MPSYLSRAVAYIEESADELERARLSGLLGRAHPEPKIIRALAIRQNDDGGYPYGMIPGRPSAIASTVTGLQWMHDIHLAPGEYAERAVGYLLCIQRPEGDWDETPAVLKYDPPLALRPGRRARHFWTALVSFWLARFLGLRHDTVARAYRLLRAGTGDVSPDGPVEARAFTTAMSALVEGPASPPALGGLTELSRLTPESWTLDALADTLGAFAVAEVARDHSFIVWGIDRVLTAQRPDGGWTSTLSPDRDVDLSLRVLGSLLALGVSAR